MAGLKSVRNRRNDALSRIGWDRLEHLLANHYRRAGYHVEHVGTGGSGRRFDGGIDLKLRKDGACVLVQSKHWNAYQVTHNAVHELLGVMVNERANGAILVTSGEFTRAAIEAATRHGHVQLVDGDALRAMLGPLPELEPPVVSHAGSVMGGRTATGKDPARMAWLVVAAICMLGFVFVIRALLQRTAGTAGPSPVTAHAPREPLPEPTVEAGPVSVTPVAVPEGCELIDHYSRTYDCPAPAGVPSRPPPTEAEIRASQRRADEAIKVIEATTPEM